MLVTDEQILDFLEMDDEAAEVSLIKNLRDSVEKWISNYCHRTFESTTYKEYYDGPGTNYLNLKNFPVSALYRLSIGRKDVIQIKNTNTYTTASVSVTSSGLVLEYDSTTWTDITFATYGTLTLVVDAINAKSAYGWSASLSSTDYASIKSNTLVEMYGRNCIDSNTVYLQIPDDPEDKFELYPTSGRIYLYSGFGCSPKSIYVHYTAGYDATSIPEDLKLAVKQIVKDMYNKQTEDTFGVKSFSIGDVYISYEQGLFSKESLSIVDSYKRYIF